MGIAGAPELRTLPRQRGAPPRPPDPVAEALRLLDGGRDLLLETRRLLSEARLVVDRPPGSDTPSNVAATMRHGNARRLRLVALVPAATGLVLLGVAVPEVTSSPGQHAVSVALNQAPAVSLPAPSPTLTPRRAISATEPTLAPPVWMSVPRLHTTASVVGEVQVQTSGPEKGLLTAPPNYHDLGWFRQGDTGILVLDGHVGYRSDPGPLAFIGELQPGDRVVVASNRGQQSYQVEVVAAVPKGQLPSQYFRAAYDADVMLITCDYNSPFRDGHFADNVYVVAAPAP